MMLFAPADRREGLPQRELRLCAVSAARATRHGRLENRSICTSSGCTGWRALLSGSSWPFVLALFVTALRLGPVLLFGGSDWPKANSRP